MGVLGYSRSGNPQELPGQLQWSKITTALLMANQNDFDTEGLFAAALVRLRAGTAISITGFAQGSATRFMRLVNVYGFNITLTNEDAASAAPNRMNLGGANVTMAPNAIVDLQYDEELLRWLLVASSTGGGSGGGGAPIFNASVSAALGASEDNFDPAGWDGGDAKSRLLLTPNAGGSTLTGLDATAVVDGQAVLVCNQDLTTDAIILENQSGSSLAANRFACPDNLDVALVPGATVIMIYDATLSLWRFA